MTVFCTIAALVLLYGIFVLLRLLNQAFGTGTYRGWEVEIKEDGSREGKEWTRSNWRRNLRSWLWKKDLATSSEQEGITEQSRLLG